MFPNQQGDVIKRKDIIKAKKQGGFASAEKSSIVERYVKIALVKYFSSI